MVAVVVVLVLRNASIVQNVIIFFKQTWMECPDSQHSNTIIPVDPDSYTVVVTGVADLYDTQLVIRAIGVSNTACRDEFRRNLRSHSWRSVFSLFIIITIITTKKSFAIYNMTWYILYDDA